MFFAFSAIVTPTPDPFGMTIMAMPTYVTVVAATWPDGNECSPGAAIPSTCIPPSATRRKASFAPSGFP